MGYRSELVIAVKKEVIARDLITQEIPAVIKELDKSSTDIAVYFFINHWKWYSSYEEVQAIEKWFASMDPAEFGAMRIGEDDNDIETWGEPYDFDIYLERHIGCPVSQD